MSGAIAGEELPVAGHRPAMAGDAEADQPHWFCGAAAPRPGDARHQDRKVGPRASESTVHHRMRRRVTNAWLGLRGHRRGTVAGRLAGEEVSLDINRVPRI